MDPSKELLLLRHGIAEDRSPEIEEARRSLTTRGRKRTRAVLTRAKSLGLQAERLLSSPLARARQTAEIAVSCGLAPAVVLADALAPAGDPLPLLEDWLSGGAAAPARLLLVGHEPDLGLLASHLIGAPEGAITLRKAGLALLRFSAGVSGRAELRLLLTPAALLEASTVVPRQS